MQYLLELFLNGNLNQTLNEDFIKKQNNMQYIETIHSQLEQQSLIAILQQLTSGESIVRLKYELDSIDEEELYTSFIHGINHNERVLFWAYVLSLQCGLDEVGTRIVLDASKYHDVGRINDLVDPSHGERSASAIIELVNDPIYENPENMKLLQAIVELHSLNDTDSEKVRKKYGITDKKTFYTLFSILKDADALDRIRITYMQDTVSCLNPAYLRLLYSKRLLLAAHELNEFYMKNEEHTKGGKHEKYLY
ncbi:MAG: hypothetical protein HFH08_01370 [Bacilli bacterium]|nr:hypothetical protein [Bacilli bacterium]